MMHAGVDEMSLRKGAVQNGSRRCRMSGETVRLGYPRVDEFAAFIDPRFRSRFWARVMG